MKRNTLLFKINIKYYFLTLSIILYPFNTFPCQQNAFLTELRPFFSENAALIEDAILSSKNLNVNSLQARFLKIDQIAQEFEIKLNKDSGYFFKTFNNAINFELTYDILIKLKDKLITQLDEILIATDYWFLHVNSPNFQDKVENKILHKLITKEQKLAQLNFLKNRTLKFLGKFDELIIDMENSFSEQLKAVIYEAIFTINNFFNNGVFPGDLDYSNSLDKFKAFSKIKIRKIIVNNSINIQAIDLLHNKVLNLLQVPNYFKKNWLKLSLVSSTFILGSYFTYKNKNEIKKKMDIVKKKLSNIELLKYKGDLNQIIYDDSLKLMDKGYIPDGNYEQPNLKFLIKMKQAILDLEILNPELTGISGWFKGRINDMTDGSVGNIAVLSKKMPDFIHIHYLILYRMILDGYDFIKYPALLTAISLTSIFIWQKVTNKKNINNKLNNILINFYQILIPYCSLNSNNNLLYKDRGLFVYWIDQINNMLDTIQGEEKVALIKLIDSLKSKELSLQAKANLIKLEQEQLLFGV